MKETITIEEAARLLKVHPTTVRRQIKQGHLKAYKVGRQYRLDPATLTEALAHEPPLGWEDVFKEGLVPRRNTSLDLSTVKVDGNWL